MTTTWLAHDTILIAIYITKAINGSSYYSLYLNRELVTLCNTTPNFNGRLRYSNIKSHVIDCMIARISSDFHLTPIAFKPSVLNPIPSVLYCLISPSHYFSSSSLIYYPEFIIISPYHLPAPAYFFLFSFFFCRKRNEYSTVSNFTRNAKL